MSMFFFDDVLGTEIDASLQISLHFFFAMTINKWLNNWLKRSFLSFYLIPSSSSTAFFLCPCQDLLLQCQRHKTRSSAMQPIRSGVERLQSARRIHCWISKWCHAQVLFCAHASAFHRHSQSHYSSFVLLSIILHRSQQENTSCTLDLWKQLVAPEDASTLLGQ